MQTDTHIVHTQTTNTCRWISELINIKLIKLLHFYSCITDIVMLFPKLEKKQKQNWKYMSRSVCQDKY